MSRPQKNSVIQQGGYFSDEYEYSGSERTIRDYVAKVRQQPKEVFLPLAFEPGEMAQVDWAEVTIYLNRVPTKVYLFCFVLNYSGALYCEAFSRAHQEAFFQGHANAFSFFGGVPHTATYDNLSSAVKRILEGQNREENERFSAFRGSYVFDSRFCNPARDNEKGRVENMVKFVERNFCTPVPRVKDLSELNTFLQQCCRDYQNRVQARQESPIEQRLQEEQPSLMPLPTYPPECCRIISVKVDKSALVNFETNRYSVPTEYAYQTLWLKAFVDRIEITNSEKMVASHARLTGRNQESILVGHYRKVLERKPGAITHLRARAQDHVVTQERVTERDGYPQVYVQPPNLSIYRQLLRNS